MSETEKDLILTITFGDDLPSMHEVTSVAGAYYIIVKAFGADKKAIRAGIREGRIKLYSRAGNLERRITARAL